MATCPRSSITNNAQYVNSLERVAFHPCEDGRHHLFAVRPGVPVRAALESACHLLDAAEVLAARAGHEADESLNDSCGYLIGMARAAVLGCLEGLERDAG
ncbi:MAG: DUF3077 domain-containing protein [Pseudomonas indica]|nr:DUF3077 domain-containing protein [Pseudomonas indica]MBU3059630.1 DUF3077 domain-containing protein [Pseudomonas indica]